MRHESSGLSLLANKVKLEQWIAASCKWKPIGMLWGSAKSQLRQRIDRQRDMKDLDNGQQKDDGRNSGGDGK